MASRTSLRLIASLLVPAVASLCPPIAFAEEVVLTSGTRYDASEVVLLEKAVRFTYHPGGGTATVTYPFERLDAHNLVSLFAARLKPNDAAGQLRLARLALERGLLADAAYRFRKAAQIDPVLASDRDAGLAAIARGEVERILRDAEEDLRRGRSDLAIARAKSVLARVPPDSDLALKAHGLIDLASKVIDRDKARIEADAKEKAAAAAAATEAAFLATMVRAEKALASAVDRRSRAADPNASASAAIRSLESAEDLFREGRRLIAAARPNAGSHAADLETDDRDAMALLVATHLDLAELYRRQRRFEKAQDRVRAALVLDPANARANEIQNRIADDLRAPVTPYVDPGFLYEESYPLGDPYLGSRVYRVRRWPYRWSRASGSSWHGSTPWWGSPWGSTWSFHLGG